MMDVQDPNLDFISRAEKRIQSDLLTGDWFQGVEILTNANGDLDAKITEALAALGLFVVISVNKGPVPVPGHIEEWDCTIVITENALFNRSGSGATGKTARLAVQKIISRAANCHSVELKTAAEVVAAEGVVWSLAGVVSVALPVEPEA